VEHGWHAEFGLPLQELDPDFGFLKKLFPSASVLLIGYGKRTFITAPPDNISEYFIGPVPGPSVVQVVGLNAKPTEIYPTGDVVALPLEKNELKTLLDYIWSDFLQDDKGQPVLVSRGTNPEGLFYAARSEYNLMHTCNTWTAKGLHQIFPAFTDQYIVFSGQVMTQVNDLAQKQCGLIL
jgi:hypothetical protein